MDERQGQDQDSKLDDKAEPDASAVTPSEPSQEAAASAESAAANNDVPAASAESAAATNDVPAERSPQPDAESHEEQAPATGHEPAPIKFSGALPALLSYSPDPSPILPAAAAPTPQPGSLRFLLLAAIIACAAGIGAIAGALSATGIAHRHVASAPISRTADARELVQALRTQLTELSALKAKLDSTSRSNAAQFARLAGRLDVLEHAQTGPAAKLAHMADADRLNKREAAASDITGSIAIASPPPPPAPAAPPPEAQLAGPILHDWIVQDVRNGRAMVESRHGSLFLVGSGSVMPGLGRVQEVRRQDGEWIVITERGVITSRPFR
jgi:hypothetical protein